MTSAQPLLSVCIQTYKRNAHLQEMLLENLATNLCYADKIEFVLVDFNHDDELQAWVLQNAASFLNTGYLRFFRTRAMQHYTHGLAKNTAVKLARGTIVFNLDGDNYLLGNTVELLLSVFDNGANDTVVHHYSKRVLGSCGRIGLLKHTFFKLGGYEEEPLCGEDKGLLQRAEYLLGKPKFDLGHEHLVRAIQHDRATKLINMYNPLGLSYQKSVQRNRKRREKQARNMAAHVVANAHKKAELGIESQHITRYEPETRQFVPVVASKE